MKIIKAILALLFCAFSARGQTSIQPSFVVAGSPDTTFTVYGVTPSSTLSFNGVAMTSNPISLVMGSMSVNQTDTFTGDGTTTIFTLSFLTGSNFSVTLNGVVDSPSNYTIASQTLTFTSAPGSGVAIAVSYTYTKNQTTVSQSSIALTIPAASLSTPGVGIISSSTSSQTTQIEIIGPVAQVDYWSPANWATGVGFTLTVYGQHFISGCTIVWDATNVSTTFVSETQLTGSISSGLVTAGSHGIHVIYPQVSALGAVQPNPNVPSPITTTLSPAAVAFGNQNINTSSATAEVINLGGGQATLRISSISISPSSNFSQTNNCPSTLTAGQTCSINISFLPTAATGYSATLSVTDNATNSPQTAALSGTGVTPGSPPPSSPAVQFNPTGLNFGSVQVGMTSGGLVSVLKNIGTAVLTISAIALTGTNAADFTRATGGANCPASGTVAAGATCNLSLTFTPSVAQGESASVQVTDNAADSPETLPLAGTGFTVTSSAGCGTSTPASLMCGATVNANNTVKGAIPAGFTLVAAQSFESGSLSAGQSFFSGSNIGCSFAHSGSCALIRFNNAGDQPTGMIQSGASINARTTYTSWWEFVPSTFRLNLQMITTRRTIYDGSGNTLTDLLWNWEDGAGGCYQNCTSAQSSIYAEGRGSLPNFSRYDGSYPLILGVWVQYEVWLKTNDPGSSNGFMKIYRNGTLIQQVLNVNFNGSQDMALAQLEIGGYNEALVYYQDSAHTVCSPAQTLGPYTTNNSSWGSCHCGAQCPPSGSIPTFNRYIDDVIILKQ